MRERYLETLEPNELRGKARRLAVRRALSSLQVALRRGELGADAAMGGKALPTTLMRTRLWKEGWASDSEEEVEEEEEDAADRGADREVAVAAATAGRSCVVVEEVDGPSGTGGGSACGGGQSEAGDAVAPKRVGYGQALKATRFARAQAMSLKKQNHQGPVACGAGAEGQEGAEEDVDAAAADGSRLPSGKAGVVAAGWRLSLLLPLPFAKVATAGSRLMSRSPSLEALQEAVVAAAAAAASAAVLPSQRDVRRAGITTAAAVLSVLQTCLQHCSPAA